MGLQLYVLYMFLLLNQKVTGWPSVDCCDRMPLTTQAVLQMDGGQNNRMAEEDNVYVFYFVNNSSFWLPSKIQPEASSSDV